MRRTIKVPPIPPAEFVIVRNGVERTVTVYAHDGHLRELDCSERLTAPERGLAREALIAAMDADPATSIYRDWLEEEGAFQ